MNRQQLIEMIDFTLLKPTATKDDITDFCNTTIEHGFRTVFVNPYYVTHAHSILSDHGIKVGVPIGFSLGGGTTQTKVAETKEAIGNGAEEIDMLINLGALKSGEFDVVENDIREVVKASDGLTTKVIIETALLTEDEKVTACKIIQIAGADYVKTATGFNGGGATVEDIRLLRSVTGPDFGVKAAGGIRTYEDAVNIVEAGANRIGTSGAVALISGEQSSSTY
ncbi:deoxyribose-phosphate aldolase [Salinicoccus sp. ID82-1]|uniref:deoxyribose-phosphate aldolase n=1 Tax=Salinicoccus sp. ID82-1 TaxID=2820269 RepID=UPI001F00E184|nr:deoxyribose-phosphate aldolase [Salinicoccus sp. ID82-1]MCG1009729.1 deoxyribose-phosphate aldolase [Salinicoccus sp. ID82-1]